MLVDDHAARAAVAVCVAPDGAGEPLEVAGDVGDGGADGASVHEEAAFVVYADGAGEGVAVVADAGALNRGEEERGGVVGVRPVGRGRRSVVGGFVARQRGLRALPGVVVDAAELRLRPAEVDAHGMRLLEEVGHEGGGAADERDALEAVEFPRLPGEFGRLGAEERKEDAVRFGGGELGEDAAHIRVAFAHDGLGGNLSAKRAELGCERSGERARVGVAVVNGDDAPEAEVAPRETGDRRPLMQVVVGDAEVARMAVARRVAHQVGRERGGGVGGRDHHESADADEGRGGDGGGGAGRADDAQRLRVGDGDAGGFGAALRGALAVEGLAEVYGVAVHAAEVLGGQPDSVEEGLAERRGAGHREDRSDPDGGAGIDGHDVAGRAWRRSGASAARDKRADGERREERGAELLGRDAVHRPSPDALILAPLPTKRFPAGRGW